MAVDILILIVCVAAAYGAGKLVSLIKMPQILGWLIAGMILGPHVLNLLNNEMIESHWYTNLNHISEVTFGLLIGTELLWLRIKSSGKQIITIAMTEAMGAFILVTLAFTVFFAITDIPIYIAPILGAISLATAPAPSISIVNQYKASGPVTRTLIPVAVLDDIIGMIVFFSVLGFVAIALSTKSIPFYFIPIIFLAPIILGAALGFIASFVLKRVNSKHMLIIVTCASILVTTAVGSFVNHRILPVPAMNLLLMGVAFFAVVANKIDEKKVEKLAYSMRHIVTVALIIVILSLGAPLDFKLIAAAGATTFIYILFRAIGKIGGTVVGASISKAPSTVKKYLGFTLLPHSGVSLIFTGIAVNVLMHLDPSNTAVIEGTIAAAAVINEIIAVFLAKFAFKRAGEIK